MAYHSGGGVTRTVYGRTYERLGSITAAGQKYEMPDLWGSPMYTADAQGNAEWRAGHDIWGRPSAAETDADKRFTNYLYDPVIGKYFAQARFYDSGQGRMLSPDPIKRRINPYPYCDNDPVNYNDPTGEIPSILLGASLGGIIGGASGFIGSAASQLTGGGKFNWKKAAGAAANGAVVGAAKGALIGSGAGIPIAFATDFVAGSVGNALEQKITKGRVDLGESLISGAGNALSEVLYGTGPIKGVKDAFLRGARTGAAMSGLDNIARAAGLRGAEPGSNPGGGGRSRGAAGAGTPGHAGRDPRGKCGSPDPFDLAETLGDRRRSQGGVRHGGGGRSRTGEDGGFSLGGLVKDMMIGGIVGGLGSVAFYGAGRAVNALREHLVGGGNDIYTVPKPNHGQGFSRKGYFPKPEERTLIGYVEQNADPEISLYTRAKGFNNGKGSVGGIFKRLGAKEHYKLSPHVHQPVRDIAPDGTVYGKTGKTVGIDTFSPDKKRCQTVIRIFK